MINRIDETIEMKELPTWLQELWELDGHIARRAEKHYLELQAKLKNNGALGGVSGSLHSVEEDISFLEEYNLHPHVNQELKILTEDSEGAHLCKEDIIKLIDVLIRYVDNSR